MITVTRLSFLALPLAALLSAAAAEAAPGHREYEQSLCAGMEHEVDLPNGTRADCVSPTHAIEIEFSESWAEALGQALSYAASTGKLPGIFLVCRHEQGQCLKHALRLEETVGYWKLPVTVWRVEATDTPAPRN
jgi:hypothetical protein